jgi:hypothetical protein
MAEAKAADKAADKKKDAKAKKGDKKSAGGFGARFTRWFSAAGCASCLTAV